jgi:hypothetical protein
MGFGGMGARRRLGAMGAVGSGTGESLPPMDALTSFAWATTETDNTPGFDVGLPAAALADDVLRIEYDGGAGYQLYLTYVLQAADIVAGSITGVASGDPLSDGSYTFRARLERTGYSGSPYSTDAVTIAVTPAADGIELEAASDVIELQDSTDIIILEAA